MRPSTRLMGLAIAAFVVAMLAIAIEALPNETGLILFGILGVMLAADLMLSRARGGVAIVTSLMAVIMAAMSGIIGGEVVLLGLIALGHGVAVNALQALGIDLASVSRMTILIT